MSAAGLQGERGPGHQQCGAQRGDFGSGINEGKLVIIHFDHLRPCLSQGHPLVFAVILGYFLDECDVDFLDFDEETII